jgi:hypothetical protein
MRIRVIKRDSVLSEALRGLWLNRLRQGLIEVSVLLSVVGFPFPQSACAAPVAPDLTITVRVYDYTRASPTILVGAEREAGRIFHEAGLKVVWLDCTNGPTPIPQDLCQEALEAEDVRLRIVLALGGHNFHDTAFGFAIAPALATVYYESALGFANYDQAEFEASIVLGCAIAHEIGHLLLGSNSHSVFGIMRARWDRRDIQEGLMGAMLFTPKQARLMQTETQRRIILKNSRPATGPYDSAR